MVSVLPSSLNVKASTLGASALLKLIQILERGSQAGAQKMLDGSGNSCTASWISSSYSGPEEFSWWNPKKRNECVQDSSLEVGTQGERPSDGKSVSSMEGPGVTITSKQTSTSLVTMQTTGHNQWPPHPSKQLLLIEICRNILDSF